jgi:cell division protein FtsL
MNIKQRRAFFYFFIYFLITLIAIIGLNFNVRTIPLNEKIRLTNKKIYNIKEENEKLNLVIQNKISLENIERIATKLEMKEPRKINYIRVTNKHEN